MKKKLLAMLTLCCMMGGAGCDLTALLGGGTESPSDSLTAEVTEELQFKQLLGGQERKTLAVGETVTFAVDTELGDKNYMKLLYDSNVNLYGEFVYSDLADPTKVVEECFYLGTESTEFKQFLDAYRPNGIGLFEKHLKSITLTNVDTKPGIVTLNEVGVADRDIPEVECEVYLHRNGLKIGVDLALGGSITFVARTDFNGQTVDEIITADGRIKYGVNAKAESGAELITSEANLVTIYDPGRQIQQSYYAEVGGTDDRATGENGYQRGFCFTDSSEGDWWSYNPVQAGDCADNPAQLIDYEVKDNQIYVKARPLDWGKGYANKWKGQYERKAEELGITVDDLGLVEGGVTCQSYMENWYTIKGGMLYVDNNFVCWEPFTDMNKITNRTNEIPAFFPVHTLHTFVTYEGASPWSGEIGGLKVHKNPPSHGSGNHVGVKESWFAWVNDDNFGMGLYVPNVDYYAYSKINPNDTVDGIHNGGAFTCPTVSNPELMKNKAQPTSNYTSCYVFNACYTAPVVMGRMKAYTPMGYQYVLAVDQLDTMRSNFYDIHNSGIITNESLNVWRT